MAMLAKIEIFEHKIPDFGEFYGDWKNKMVPRAGIEPATT